MKRENSFKRHDHSPSKRCCSYEQEEYFAQIYYSFSLILLYSQAFWCFVKDHSIVSFSTLNLMLRLLYRKLPSSSLFHTNIFSFSKRFFPTTFMTYTCLFIWFACCFLKLILLQYSYSLISNSIVKIPIYLSIYNIYDVNAP